MTQYYVLYIVKDATMEFHVCGTLTALCYVSYNNDVGACGYHMHLLFFVCNQHLYCLHAFNLLIHIHCALKGLRVHSYFQKKSNCSTTDAPSSPHSSEHD